MDPLARILSTEADVYVARGDYARAVSNGVDGVRWGTDLARDGDILALENGLLIEGSGFNNIKRSSIDRLDVRSAQALALRLEILDACRFSYTRTLQNEKITGLKRLEMIFKFQDWRKNLPTTQSSAQIITTYERLMNETIIDVALPYPRRRGVSVDGADALSKVIFGTLARQDATHLSTMGSGSFYENLRAISRLDATMLALRAFKAEHGKYPMTLSELTPTILRRVPVDPFSDKPLRYKLKAIEYSLYSVGYDGVDDGGKALPKRAKPNAKGDIVAGVNTP